MHTSNHGWYVKRSPRTVRAVLATLLLLNGWACSNGVSSEVLAIPREQVVPVAVRKPFDAASAGSAWSGLNGLAVRGSKFVIADPQAPGLFVFDSLMAVPRRVGTGGDGPAELRRPRSLVWTSDSTFVVHDYQRYSLSEWDALQGRLLRRADLRGRPTLFRFLGRLVLGEREQLVAAPWEESLLREVPPAEVGAPALMRIGWDSAGELAGWGKVEYPPGSKSSVLASVWARGDAFAFSDTLHRLRSRDGVLELYDLRSLTASPVATRTIRGFLKPREIVDQSQRGERGNLRASVVFDPLFESATRLSDGRIVAVANTPEYQIPPKDAWPQQVLAVYAANGNYLWGARLPGGVYRWLQASGDTLYVLGFDARETAKAERALQVFVLPAASRPSAGR